MGATPQREELYMRKCVCVGPVVSLGLEAAIDRPLNSGT